jgi:uncharacterized protein YkwD
MQAPRPTKRIARQLHAPGRTASRRPFFGCIVLVGSLFLVGASGVVWLWTQPLHRDLEPSIAGVEKPPPSSKPSEESPNPIEDEVPAENISKQTTSLVDNHPADTSPRRSNKPLPPVADAPNLPPAARTSGSHPVANLPVPPPVARGSSSTVAEKKTIVLEHDLPPELPFDLVDSINIHRKKAGAELIFLDTELSRACQSRAERLARHIANLDETPSPADGEEKFETAALPLAAVEKCLKEPKRRAAILEPRLRTFGAGYARNVTGEWFSVFDWKRGLDRKANSEANPVTGAIVYPAPGQTRVPLWFPGNETPDPLPQTEDKVAGFPITLIFPPQTLIKEAAAHLSNKDENDVPIWLSSPEKPANPQFEGAQQYTICLIAKKPLRPNTRYHVEVSATVNDAAWSAKWDFLTISEGEIHHEMAGSFLRKLNRLRRGAGLPQIPLDAERSKTCAAHVRYLIQNVPTHSTLNWNEEKPDQPGYTAAGAELARTASIQGGGGPLEAVSGLMDSIISRPQLLHPRLHDLGLGYSPFALGGWLWVIDLHRDPGREADREYFYPAPDQDNVPLIYPPNEMPSPIPADHKSKMAGYAITVLFGPRVRVTTATAKLVDEKGREVDGWLSSPENPAISGYPQHLLCLLPKMPLRPGTRYTTTFQAEVNGRPWKRTWSFTTIGQPDRYADDLEEKILAHVNKVRKAAGLGQVRLDTELSRACQSHARYLSLNNQRPAAQGMGVHRQEANLPGATPEGAKAARGSVIAVMLDPRGCVENWMATLYHRIPILRQDLERIGFGHARIQGHKWACVLDTGNGREAPSRDR